MGCSFWGSGCCALVDRRSRMAADRGLSQPNLNSTISPVQLPRGEHQAPTKSIVVQAAGASSTGAVPVASPPSSALGQRRGHEGRRDRYPCGRAAEDRRCSVCGLRINELEWFRTRPRATTSQTSPQIEEPHEPVVRARPTRTSGAVADSGWRSRAHTIATARRRV
jgi:hypothetical protein